MVVGGGGGFRVSYCEKGSVTALRLPYSNAGDPDIIVPHAQKHYCKRLIMKPCHAMPCIRQ